MCPKIGFWWCADSPLPSYVSNSTAVFTGYLSNSSSVVTLVRARCCSQMFLSIQSPKEAGGCTFPKHSLGTLRVSLIVACGIAAERLEFTAGFVLYWGTKTKAWMLRLIIRTLFLYNFRPYLLTILDHAKTKKTGRCLWICDIVTWP